MAEYVYIQDYSKKGKLGISKTCFEQIISLSTNKIQGVQTADNQINVQVKIKQGNNIEKICTNIQEQIAEDITTMVELVPFSIKVKVVSII